MGAMASQITSLTIVFSTVYSDSDQRKHQSSATLALCGEGPVNSPHKWSVTRKKFPFHEVIIKPKLLVSLWTPDRDKLMLFGDILLYITARHLRKYCSCHRMWRCPDRPDDTSQGRGDVSWHSVLNTAYTLSKAGGSWHALSQIWTSSNNLYSAYSKHHALNRVEENIFACLIVAEHW